MAAIKKEHEEKYYRENPIRKEKKQIFEIQQEDMKLIYELGQYAHLDPKLLVTLSYYWCIQVNMDRPSEKLRGTKLADFWFQEWKGTHYFMRDPCGIVSKVKSAKTRRSFGILVYVPSAPAFQPYNLIRVSRIE